MHLTSKELRQLSETVDFVSMKGYPYLGGSFLFYNGQGDELGHIVWEDKEYAYVFVPGSDSRNQEADPFGGLTVE